MQPASGAYFTLADISDVSFQYGTNLKDPGLNLAGTISGGSVSPVIPEPDTAALIATGLLWAFALVRRPGASLFRGNPKSVAPVSGDNPAQAVHQESG